MTAYIDPAARIADLEARLAAAEIREAHREQVIGDLTYQLAERTRQATRDPLTGLLNRRGMEELWPTLPAGLSAALIDLDHFKRINDTHGHHAGDLLLVAVAGLIRPYGTAVRLGGDELLLITDPVVLDQWQASWWIDLPGVGRLTVTGTTGVTEVLPDLGETLRRADVAMYHAKASGRGSRQVWSVELDATVPAAALPARRQVRDAALDDRPGEEITLPRPWRPCAAPTVAIDDDPLCGHLPGEPHDDECDYWRGVQLGWYPAPEYLTTGRAA